MSEHDLKELDETIAEEQEIVETAVEDETAADDAADQDSATVEKAQKPKTKAGMINAMLDAVKGKKKDEK